MFNKWNDNSKTKKIVKEKSPSLKDFPIRAYDERTKCLTFFTDDEQLERWERKHQHKMKITKNKNKNKDGKKKN